MDVRCEFCNWLNKEVGDEFVCQNCKKTNRVEEDGTQEEKKIEPKKIKVYKC